MEFTSPILVMGANNYWYASARFSLELFYIFLIKHCGFEIVKSDSCSTHVHVSPIPRKKGNSHEWNTERTKRVAVSSMFFEPAIRSLLPEDRWINLHAR